MSSRDQSDDAAREGGAESLPTVVSMPALEGFNSTVSSGIQQWAGEETILLAEDEAFVRKAAGEALESAGYIVVATGSGTQALEAYSKCAGQVDLLLADLVMPGIGGHELANQLLLLCPNVRVLLMSGYAERLALYQQSSCGTKYLAKPFSIPVLLKRVREVLDARPVDWSASA